MLKVVVYADLEEKRRVGFFVIPDDANKDWLERNVPTMLLGVRVLADETSGKLVSNVKEQMTRWKRINPRQ